MGLGVFLVIGGFREVFNTRYNITDENTVHLHPQEIYPYVYDQHLQGISTSFETNDMFAAYNKIDVGVVAFLLAPQNINQTVAFQVVKTSEMSWVNNQTTLNKELKILHDHNRLFQGKLLWSNAYEMNFTVSPNSNDGLTIWVFLQTLDGKWFSYGNLDFPTLEPASSLIQLKNSKVIEGLTWVIVGAIPIGLVSEICILYFVEGHFYRKGKTERDFGLPND
jgi:hypothetical protein